jgi:serine/threonine protein kinase
MENNSKNNRVYMNKVDQALFPYSAADYAEIMKFLNLEYKISDYYLQTGEISHVQGWMLHISVVISEVPNLLKTIIPFLISEKIPFKIPINKDTALYLANGVLGPAQLGKIMTIYPLQPNLISVAQKLVLLTQAFKGPRILTDAYLGGNVYTRYGSCNPVLQRDDSNKEDKYIYNIKGELVKDPYSMPFQLPEGIYWPFEGMGTPVASKPRKIIHNFYKKTGTLKDDVRGNVYKAIMAKGFLKTVPCVIKQGLKYMSSEETGRNIYDRLLWQKTLQEELSSTIAMPKIFDFFTEKEDHYLTMEYIEGLSLHHYIKSFNFMPNNRFIATTKEYPAILNYLIQIINLIDKLHQQGYVHRDIQPNNFIIDNKGKVFMIDTELAWSITRHTPNPPFELGTDGFMSPEQQMMQLPTIEGDIYGLGALMINIYTRISPEKFNVLDPILLEESLLFFTGNRTVSSMLSTCLNSVPSERPHLSKIISFLEEQKSDKIQTEPLCQIPFDEEKLKQTISAGLNGLNKAPIVIADNVWYSKDKRKANRGATGSKEYTRSAGMQEGVSGVLYMLARAKKAGYKIDSCIDSYEKSWEYLQDVHLSKLPLISSGLYNGGAGIALAIAEGFNAGLLEKNKQNISYLHQCLQLYPEVLDVANGIAGQGIAMLQCIEYLDLSSTMTTLSKYVNKIISKQQKDGSWFLPISIEKDEKVKRVGFSYGIAGIVYFLLDYSFRYHDESAKKAAIKALKWLDKQTGNLMNLFSYKALKKRTLDGDETGDERTGVIITFIKAYETLNDEYYRKVVERALLNYPQFVLTNDFTQNTGLAGLGEVYLEAAKAFKNIEWRKRAEWIAQTFIHTRLLNHKNGIYWNVEERTHPTADLLMGISGIIHFLMRCTKINSLGYRLLS